MADSFDFFLEEVAWPYVHVLVPAAVYIEFRRIDWALLVIYISESVEAVLRPFFVQFGETLDDSLIGDIVLGSLAIAALWFLDIATGAASAFRRAEPVSVRALGLVLPPLYSAVFLFDLPAGTTFDVRVLIFYALYALTILSLHTRSIFWPRAGTRDQLSGRALLVWLAAALVLTVFALPITDGTRALVTRWMRMLYVILFFFFLALAAAFVSALYPKPTSVAKDDDCDKQSTVQLLLSGGS